MDPIESTFMPALFGCCVCIPPSGVSHTGKGGSDFDLERLNAPPGPPAGKRKEALCGPAEDVAEPADEGGPVGAGETLRGNVNWCGEGERCAWW
jgi:hypothetical protein